MISKEKLKQQFKAIMSLDSHPGHISAGFAVGVFISFTPPIPGLHTGLALVDKLLAQGGMEKMMHVTLIALLAFAARF